MSIINVDLEKMLDCIALLGVRGCGMIERFEFFCAMRRRVSRIPTITHLITASPMVYPLIIKRVIISFRIGQ